MARAGHGHIVPGSRDGNGSGYKSDGGSGGSHNLLPAIRILTIFSKAINRLPTPWSTAQSARTAASAAITASARLDVPAAANARSVRASAPAPRASASARTARAARPEEEKGCRALHHIGVTMIEPCCMLHVPLWSHCTMIAVLDV
ncbi:hypothetical protein ACKKBG_A26625 [Auxenochlorella protothecoides x Auxenochlorella symbiontica]